MYKLALAIASVLVTSSLAYGNDKVARTDAGVSVAAENAATRKAEQALGAELSRFEVDVAQAREDAETPPVIEYRRAPIVEYRRWTPVFGSPSVDQHGGVHRRLTY